MTSFFILRAHGILSSELIADGRVTPTGCTVPATVMVTIPAEVVDGSIPAVSAASSAGTSLPANSVSTTFWRLGSEGEAEGLQQRQCQHATIPIFDNSPRQQLHTWGVRLHAHSVCAQPDDPEGPMAKLRSTPRMVWGSCSFSPSLRFPFPPGGSRSRSFCRLAELWMLEPFLLLPRRWEEGGLVGGCRVVVDSSGTTLCVPVEDFQLAVAVQHNLFQK
jgi:hypothetical protein